MIPGLECAGPDWAGVVAAFISVLCVCATCIFGGTDE